MLDNSIKRVNASPSLNKDKILLLGGSVIELEF